MCLCIPTCRFFSPGSSGHRTDSAPTSSPTPTPTPAPSQSAGLAVCVEDSPSPPPSPLLTPPRAASQGFRLFDWPSKVPSTKQPAHLHPEEAPARAGSEERPDSPLSQDSAYWSQFQPHKGPDSKQEEEEEEDAAPVSRLEDGQQRPEAAWLMALSFPRSRVGVQSQSSLSHPQEKQRRRNHSGWCQRWV